MNTNIIHYLYVIGNAAARIFGYTAEVENDLWATLMARDINHCKNPPQKTQACENPASWQEHFKGKTFFAVIIVSDVATRDAIFLAQNAARLPDLGEEDELGAKSLQNHCPSIIEVIRILWLKIGSG